MIPTVNLTNRDEDYGLCPGCHKARIVARVYREGRETGITLYCPICNATYRYDEEEPEPEEPEADYWDNHGFKDAADYWRYKCL